MAMTLDEILDLPGNRPVFGALTKLLNEGRAVAFVGAGSSSPMYPLWGEFIEMLAQHAVTQGKADQKDADRWKADKTSTPQQRVNNIVRRLGEDAYRRFLKQTFSPWRGSGRPYTATHAAFLRLPFRGYVTTNYDPALEFARIAYRPDCRNTATPTWQDEDEIHRWLTGDVFDGPDDCPVLWLHGHWQRPTGIVLNAGEYSQAYKPGLYRKTFERLWLQEHLVFAGFSFGDPQFSFMVGEMMRDIAEARAEPRHVAILGLPTQQPAVAIDEGVIRDCRDSLEADYHVRALFYPVLNGDHSGLHVLLDGVTLQCAGNVRPVPPGASTPPSPEADTYVSKWVHETTNDEKFTGRTEDMERLNRWVRDPAVRAVAVCAVGGTGKTAIIGHWLKNTDGWRTRPFVGMFGWSFYQNQDTNDFFDALLLWMNASYGVAKPEEGAKHVQVALALLGTIPCVLMLDGLEVLQEGPDDLQYGSFLDGELREFLTAFCHRQHRSLAVLTSRFVFADLERYLGTSFHQHELHGLPRDQGAELLADLAVRGNRHEREQISDRLDGHPLALRVFADALPDSDRDTPSLFLDHAFHVTNLPGKAPLARRVTSLLAFYEKQLSPAQLQLLTVVALFRTPVPDATVFRLVIGIFGQDPKYNLQHEASVSTELQGLHKRGILSREPLDNSHGYSCHPILRDHFRSVLLRPGREGARRAADLLTQHPSKSKPLTLREVEPVILAIALLLDAGEFREADQLFIRRLDNGGVFVRLPAASAGLACALGFIMGEPRRQQCERQCSRSHLGNYLNAVGTFAMNCGHYELAIESLAASNRIAEETTETLNHCIGLRNEGLALAYVGRLDRAQQVSDKSRELAQHLRDERHLFQSYCQCGWVFSQIGKTHSAAEHFARARVLQKKTDPDGDDLYSLSGILWSEFLLRTGNATWAAQSALANLRICERYAWNDDAARCHLVLAACALAEGRPSDAEDHILLAEPIFRRGPLRFDLAKLHVITGEVALAQKEFDRGLAAAAEGYDLAAPRGMRLVHSDALVLRGRARLLEGNADCALRAVDDAEDALRLARDCGYACAERDALLLHADALGALDRREEARRSRSDAGSLVARLAVKQADLYEAEAKAKAWLVDWESSMPKP